jgi:hypothetical protein
MSGNQVVTVLPIGWRAPIQRTPAADPGHFEKDVDPGSTGMCVQIGMEHAVCLQCSEAISAISSDGSIGLVR